MHGIRDAFKEVGTSMAASFMKKEDHPEEEKKRKEVKDLQSIMKKSELTDLLKEDYLPDPKVVIEEFKRANEAEHRTWPLFREHYERWVSRAARGEVLKGPERVSIAPPSDEPPSTEEQITQLAQLRKETGL